MKTTLSAKELRIGNWIERLFEGKPTCTEEVTVRAIWDIVQIESEIKLLDPTKFSFEPIPISAEWLERAGFDREAETVWRHKNSQHVYETISGYVYRVPGTSLTIIKYVHQLQNLYFALTNQELDFTLKPKPNQV